MHLSVTTSSSDAPLFKTKNNGDALLSKNHNLSGVTFSSSVIRTVSDASGNVYAAYQASGSPQVLVLIKYDVNGTVLFSNKFVFPSYTGMQYTYYVQAIGFDETNQFLYVAWNKFRTGVGVVPTEPLLSKFDVSLNHVTSESFYSVPPQPLPFPLNTLNYYVSDYQTSTYAMSKKISSTLGPVTGYIAVAQISDSYGYCSPYYLYYVDVFPRNKSWFLRIANSYYSGIRPYLCSSIVVDASGNTYTLVLYDDYGGGGTALSYALVTAADSNGNILWSKIYDIGFSLGSIAIFNGAKLAVDASGYLYVAIQAYLYNGYDYHTLYIVRHNASTGAVDYVRDIYGPNYPSAGCPCYVIYEGINELYSFEISSSDPLNMYIGCDSYVGKMTLKLPTDGSKTGTITFPTILYNGSPAPFYYESNTLSSAIPHLIITDTTAFAKVTNTVTYTNQSITQSTVSDTSTSLGVTSTVQVI